MAVPLGPANSHFLELLKTNKTHHTSLTYRTMFSSSDRTMLGLPTNANAPASAAAFVPRVRSGNFIPSSSSSNLNSDTLAALYSNYSNAGGSVTASAGGPNLITPSTTPTDFSDTLLSPTIVDVATAAAVHAASAWSADKSSSNRSNEYSIPTLSEENPNSSSVGIDGASHHARPDTLHPTLLPAGQDHPEPSEWRIPSNSSSSSSSSSSADSSSSASLSSYGGGGYPTTSNSTSAAAIDMTGIEMLIRAAAATSNTYVPEYQQPPPSSSSPRPVIEYQYNPQCVTHVSESAQDAAVVQGSVVLQDTTDTMTTTTIKKKRPRTLYTEEDPEVLNKLHCIIREKLLEIYEYEGEANTNNADDNVNADDPSPPTKKRRCTTDTTITMVVEDLTKPPPRVDKKVCLRCAFCKSTTGKACIYPQSLDNPTHFYNKIMHFRKDHFDICPWVPDTTRREVQRADLDRTRGRKQYWVKTAGNIGLINVVDENGRAAGVRFAD